MHAELRAHPSVPWLVEPGNALSRVHGRLAPDRGWAPVQPPDNRSEEDETRIPLQKAIDDADYEHGHRVNELDFL